MVLVIYLLLLLLKYLSSKFTFLYFLYELLLRLYILHLEMLADASRGSTNKGL